MIFPLQQLFIPLLSDSFDEPIQKNAVSARGSEVRRCSSEKTEFKRPSDYRRISMGAQRKQGGRASLPKSVEGEGRESDNPIKDELVTEVHGLASALEWYVSEREHGIV